jgi:hypothetical protein
VFECLKLKNKSSDSLQAKKHPVRISKKQEEIKKKTIFQNQEPQVMKKLSPEELKITFQGSNHYERKFAKETTGLPFVPSISSNSPIIELGKISKDTLKSSRFAVTKVDLDHIAQPILNRPEVKKNQEFSKKKQSISLASKEDQKPEQKKKKEIDDFKKDQKEKLNNIPFISSLLKTVFDVVFFSFFIFEISFTSTVFTRELMNGILFNFSF